MKVDTFRIPRVTGVPSSESWSKCKDTVASHPRSVETVGKWGPRSKVVQSHEIAHFPALFELGETALQGF